MAIGLNGDIQERGDSSVVSFPAEEMVLAMNDQQLERMGLLIRAEQRRRLAERETSVPARCPGIGE